MIIPKDVPKVVGGSIVERILVRQYLEFKWKPLQLFNARLHLSEGNTSLPDRGERQLMRARALDFEKVIRIAFACRNRLRRSRLEICRGFNADIITCRKTGKSFNP